MVSADMVSRIQLNLQNFQIILAGFPVSKFVSVSRKSWTMVQAKKYSQMFYRQTVIQANCYTGKLLFRQNVTQANVEQADEYQANVYQLLMSTRRMRTRRMCTRRMGIRRMSTWRMSTRRMSTGRMSTRRMCTSC